MKNTIYLALIILAAFPASAQKAANPNPLAVADGVVASSRDYEARIDGLLREVHVTLQKISTRMEAGEITPEQERDLKLAATRDVISRLDGLAAIYDAQSALNAKTVTKAESGAAGSSGAKRRLAASVQTTGTVSVDELKRECATSSAKSGAQERSR